MLRHNSTAEVRGVSNGLSTMPQLNSNCNDNNATNTSSSPLDVLSKQQFVFSMKTLFDILDDRRTGFVKFSDIEKGWQDDGCKGLPRGVIDSLRKVTPASGLLSFERFCAGLKLCLLKNQTHTSPAGEGDGQNVCVGIKGKSPVKPPRPPSAPLLEIETPLPNGMWTANPTATVRPRNIITTQRTLSMPQLSPDSVLEASAAAEVNVYNSPPPPPKPPRASAVAAAGNGILTTVGSVAATNAAPLDKAEIRHALQNWQMGILLNEMDSKDKRHPSSSSVFVHNPFQYRRGCADGGSSSATDSANGTISLHGKKSSSKRREPRRHTLQNGIDYNLLKRLKQFEEEREVLMHGLDAVEKARDWYLQQVSNVQEKIKYLGLGRFGTHMEQWSEVQQERLNFQRARVLEVNRNLSTLADTWERGDFPMHFNLAIRSPNKSVIQRSAISGGALGGGVSGTGILPPPDRLRQQNRYLTNEGNLKSDRIALLEREKQSLLRELFELQQRMGLGARGTGFVSVLSQSSPVCSSSSGGLGDADVVY